jgi:hypothetical protein
MSPENVLDRAIEDIADGKPVDWHLIDAEAKSDADRSWAKALRILHGVANLHRTGEDDSPDESVESSAVTIEDQSGVLPDGTHRQWGRYQLEHKLGEGSFGRVYSAWDPELERHVAIKILHRLVADTHQKHRLLREGRALARVRHSNVVSVLGIEAHEDQVGLCMEFVRGETLASVVRRHGTLSARETVLIGEDLCRALSAVHRAGFIHRDIKARNVMREQAGRIVLMDFGTGRESDRPELPGELAGTPLYMAPEVLSGEPASPRSDVYSLGVLLYYLVTAAYPVDGRTMDEVLDAHIHRRRTLLSERRPDLPVSFIRVIEKAIAAEPDERYATAGELLQALGTVTASAGSRTKWIVRAGVALGVTLGGMTLLGAMTSAVFNLVLERSGFVAETMTDSFVWGRRSSFPPVLILLMVLLTGSILAVVRRVLLASSSSARRLDAAARERVRTVMYRLRLDDVSVLASYTLLISSLVLAVTWWYFTPLIVAALTPISTATTEQLALLSPAFVTYHNYYRGAFTAVVIVSVAIWYPVARLVRAGRSPHRGIVLGGAVVTCVALALLHFPYRLLYFNANTFDAVRWKNMHCYVLGERNEDVLLFCPEASPPRTRTVTKGAETLSPIGTRESIFSRFGASPGAVNP